jgi:hypothetical protein
MPANQAFHKKFQKNILVFGEEGAGMPEGRSFWGLWQFEARCPAFSFPFDF